MRRVVVTGLGAVTPLGGDAPSTWRAAVAGESGIDFIRSFDASGFPVRIAAEVKDFDRGGVEVLHLRRDPHREAARVEGADEVDAALAGDRRTPRRRRIAAQRRDRTEPGDDDLRITRG